MPVPDVDRYRPDDRRAVEALYRRVFGTDAAEASRLRWEWQYRRNPNNPGGEPEIWIAREGPAIIGQYATMPVRLAVKGARGQGLLGHGRDGRAGTPAARTRRGAVPDVGSQRRRLARARALRRVVPAVPEAEVARRRAGAVPGEAAVAARVPASAVAGRRSTASISALTWPFVLIVSRARPLRAEVRVIQRFDDSFTALWERSRRSSTSPSAATRRI